jgi:hypothetical protein
MYNAIANAARVVVYELDNQPAYVILPQTALVPPPVKPHPLRLIYS